jgi:hypothetical protein
LGLNLRDAPTAGRPDKLKAHEQQGSASGDSVAHGLKVYSQERRKRQLHAVPIDLNESFRVPFTRLGNTERSESGPEEGLGGRDIKMFRERARDAAAVILGGV